MPPTPPERIELDDLVVRRETLGDAESVAAAIASNIPRLAPWMEWAVDDTANVEAQRARIADTIAQWDAGRMYDYIIVDPSNTEVLGKTGLHRTGDGVLEIGYWLTGAAEGRGVVTRTTSALTMIAAGMDDVVRVEIHCDAANARSQAVPQRLGYHLDRVVDHPVTTSRQTGRQMIWIYDASR